MSEARKVGDLRFAGTVKIVRQGLNPPVMFIDEEPFPFVVTSVNPGPVLGHAYPEVTVTFACERVLTVNDRLSRAERDAQARDELNREVADLARGEGESRD